MKKKKNRNEPPNIIINGQRLRECLHQKTRTGASFIPGSMTFLFRIAFTWWWIISYLGYFKVHFMLIKYTCNSKSQTLQMRYTETGNLLRVHNTGAKFHTGVKFPPRYNNRGDSRRHDILWGYHVNKYRAIKGNQSELAPRESRPGVM